MGILNDLLTRVRIVNDSLTGGGMVKDVLQTHAGQIYTLQLQQLFEGKASDGKDLHPYYSEDLKSSGGYFKSPESAARYSAWKQTGIQYPYKANRNPDAPNLYINGKFHSELGVQFFSTSVGVMPLTPYASQIVAKYQLRNFGLMASNWNKVFVEFGAYNQLLNSIKAKLYV